MLGRGDDDWGGVDGHLTEAVDGFVAARRALTRVRCTQGRARRDEAAPQPALDEERRSGVRPDAVEVRVSEEEEQGQAAEREHVRASVGAALADLRCEVALRAGEDARPPIGIREVADAEVDELHAQRVIHHDVLGLEVAEQDGAALPRVQVGQAIGDLQHHGVERCEVEDL
ncbi:MAG: hypothetical protein R3F59_21890 [Myxococcota bacterium]